MQHPTETPAQPAMEQVLTITRRRLNRAGTATAQLASEPMTLSQRMVHRRLALGLTQAQVSTEVRIQSKPGRQVSERPLSRNTYAMYEIGKSEPKLKLIEQIATALRVSAGWLAFGEGGRIAASGAMADPSFPVSINLSVTAFAVRAPGTDAPDKQVGRTAAPKAELVQLISAV